MSGDKVLHIASKLLEIKETVRDIYGDQTEEKLAPFRSLITAAMEKDGHESRIHAAIALAKSPKAQHNGMLVIMIMAAAVEEATHDAP